MATPNDILKDRAKNHPDDKTTYTGMIVSKSPSALPCDGCLWCAPEPESWKAHDEAKRILRMTEKAR